MPPNRSSSSYRRLGLYAAILLALVLVSVAGFIMATEDALLGEGPEFPELVTTDTDNPPRFVFPEGRRSTDLGLNRFVDRFVRVCMQGRYSEFRLMHTRTTPPVAPRRFESIFAALKEVRILSLEPVADPPAELSPMYLLRAEYDLAPHAGGDGHRTRVVQVAIAREGDEWRLGPVPSSVLNRLGAAHGAVQSMATENILAYDLLAAEGTLADRPVANAAASIEKGEGEGPTTPSRPERQP